MEIFLIICSLASGHAFFCAVLLFSFSERLSNRLLAFLLIMLSVRVGKSVAGFLFPENLYLLSVIGLIAMAFIGPLLLSFIRSLFETSFKLRLREIIQLSAGVFLSIFMLVMGPSFLDAAYYFTTAHMLTYIVMSGVYMVQNRNTLRVEDLKWRWIIILLSGVALIYVTFVLQLFFYEPLIYKIIVVTAALVFYSLSMWAIPKSKLFLAEYRKKVADDNGYDELRTRIVSLLAEKEVFTDTNLTVTKLAGMLKSQPYLVSRVVNKCFKMSFSELLTKHRIRKSEQLLLAEGSRSLTIEAIAYESGFNTLSSFYTCFKRENKMTPAQFRDSSSKTQMKIAN